MSHIDYKNKYNKYKSKYLLLKQQIGQGNKIIGIGGISGSGKSTLGKQIAEKLNGVYIDQDWFFKKNKPQIKLSDGSTTSNWDCMEAIDISAMNDRIKKELKNHNIIVIGGFALWDEWFEQDIKPNIHFHIKIPKELSLETRLKVKNFGSEARKKQELIFNELVYPFYQETLKNSKIDHMIEGLNDSKRRPMEEMVNEIMSKINL